MLTGGFYKPNVGRSAKRTCGSKLFIWDECGAYRALMSVVCFGDTRWCLYVYRKVIRSEDVLNLPCMQALQLF